jgi:DNA-binding NarL/FixJ family response regulator
MKKTVYIIEDDGLTCKMITKVISTYFDDIDVIGSNQNGQSGVGECVKLNPDLAIVDIRLPDVNGLELLHILKRRHPQMKVLIYSGILNFKAIQRAQQGMADGIIEKSEGIEALKAAIETVISGESYYSPIVTEQLLQHEVISSES